MTKPKCYWIRDFSLGVPKGQCKKVALVKCNGTCAEHAVDAAKHTAAEGKAYASIIAEAETNPALLAEVERVRQFASGVAYNTLKAAAKARVMEASAAIMEKLEAAKQQRKDMEKSAAAAEFEAKAEELLAPSSGREDLLAPTVPERGEEAGYAEGGQAWQADADEQYEEQLEFAEQEAAAHRPPPMRGEEEELWMFNEQQHCGEMELSPS